MDRPFHILVLCTGNSARSIVGEALVNHFGAGEVVGFSAGSKPRGVVNPTALETLEAHGHNIENYSSKSWDVFSGDNATPMDLVITVCDSAARETCPVFLGAPLRVHWGVPDPAHILPLAARRSAFEIVYAAFKPAVASLVSSVRAGTRGATLLERAIKLAPQEIEFA